MGEGAKGAWGQARVGAAAKGSRSQNWHEVPSKWTTVLGGYFTKDKTMMVGNFLQRNILHYVEPEFLTDRLISRLESV